jgi:hypothetical protein
MRGLEETNGPEKDIPQIESGIFPKKTAEGMLAFKTPGCSLGRLTLLSAERVSM